MLSLLWPQLDYVLLFTEQNPFGLAAFGITEIGRPTTSLGNVEIEHVLYFVRPPQKVNSFAFLQSFGLEVWILILFSIVLVILALSDPKNPVTILGRQAAFVSDYRIIRHRLLPVQKALLILWLTATMVLQNHFGGVMFDKLVQEPKPRVIDNLDDLAAEPHLTIRITDFQMLGGATGLKSPLNPASKHFNDFSRRLDLIEFREVSNMRAVVRNTFGDVINAPKNWNCLMGLKDYLNYIKNSLDGGRYRKRLHVSQEGAATQPYTFAELMTADAKEKKAMEDVSLHLVESGIYQKWMDVAIYGINKIEPKTRQVAYRAGRAAMLHGPISICGSLLVFALLCLLIEEGIFRVIERKKQNSLMFVKVRNVPLVSKPPRYFRNLSAPAKIRSRKQDSINSTKVCISQIDLYYYFLNFSLDFLLNIICLLGSSSE